MDVGDWLRRLGLEEYEAAFRENEIDEFVLPSLTAEDLKDLGVAIVGHRRKLLNAIATLQADAGASASLSDAPLATDKAAENVAERRHITVMFSDLVGSTALSARMDPEDLREIISAYQRCVADIVRRFGGFAAKYMGDGVLVYFGYPLAHEDDAERAVRAALEAIAAVGALKLSVTLQARVGIATGLVVVGDLIGSGEAQEHGIVGETPNIAARLQGMAEPNAVLISESTRRLVGNLFDLKDLGSQELKGIPGSIRVWVALRPSLVEGRFEALHAGRLTELIGRQEEFEMLLRRWCTAKTGEGQVVLLSGEAGIGKSRLTAALLERVAAEPHTRLRYFCSPQHTNSALYPIIGQMERAAGFAHHDDLQVKLDKLDAMLVQTSTPAQDAALFAEMLSLLNDGRYPVLDLAPQQRRQKTLEALISQLEALTRRTPVLMIFEDAHWTDPTSLEAFGQVVDVIATLPVLLIVTFRPEFEAPWIGRRYVSGLMLNRLTERDVIAMIDGLMGSAPLPPGIRENIVERTDGIPLFVEEMTRAVLEAESESEARRTTAQVPCPATAVPASLHASLMARLDRLGPAKEVAQVGAAIGREFSYPLLAAVASKPEAALGAALQRLVEAGLLFRRGVPPDVTYLFKHALVQDAAYGTLLREPRRLLHARIAQTLEDQFAETAESQPEVLARHCTEAGQIEKAAGLWGKAGQLSLERSALEEAVAQFTRALDQIASLPGTPALRCEQIKLQVALITPLSHLKGYAAPETRATVERARVLIEQAEVLGESPEDPLLLFTVLYGSWVASFISFRGDVMRELASHFLALAEIRSETVPLMVGHRLVGMSLLAAGNFVQARAHLDWAIALYDPAVHRVLAARFGQDVRVVILPWRSWALWSLGHPEAALADADQALKEAREIGHAATLMFALFHVSFIHMYCGDHATANELIEELVALADEKRASFWIAGGLLRRGWLFALVGKHLDAIQTITSGMAAWRSTGATVWMPLFLSFLANSYAEVGKFDDSWTCIDEALASIEETKETWCEAEINRTAEEIALLLPKSDPVKAEVFFHRALVVARKQQAKSWELRSAMSMARLWRDQGKLHEARDLLAPVYGWFSEGFNTLDLKQAKAMLDELAQ